MSKPTQFSGASTLRLTALASAVSCALFSGHVLADQQWSYTYTPEGLLSTINGPRTDLNDVTSFAYDAQGNLTSRTNALGHVTTLDNYSEMGLPQTVTTPDGTVTELTYDWRGQVLTRTVKSTQGDALTGFTYDPKGQLTRITLPDGTYMDYVYDPIGRLTDVSNAAGETISYTLDAMGNRTQIDIKDGADALFYRQQQVFDELGRLIKALGASGQQTT
ncbi:MAG: RHS repeat protein [Hahellaceae bacterium]|nr:RHS repeat protein [Hahellaceae bacterium]